MRDIGDVRVMLQGAITRPIPVKAGARAVGQNRLAWAGVAVGIAAILIAGFFFLRPKPAPPAEAVRFEIAQPGNAALSDVLAISPDGRRLAFIASAPGAAPQLWVRSLETLEARPLEATTAIAGLPFWSPDSRSLVFSTPGKLKRIDATGGPSQTLADLPGVALGGLWTPDNRIVIGSFGGLLQVPSGGGTLAPLKQGTGRTGISPSLLPDGRHFVFSQIGPDGGILLASLDGQEPPKRLLRDVSLAIYARSPDPKRGYLLFVRGGASGIPGAGPLMAQTIDTGSLALIGEAVPVAEKASATGFSASTTGVLVYGTGGTTLQEGGIRIPGLLQGQLTWFDRGGKALSTIGESGVYRIPALSPDGKQVALEAVDRQSNNMDLWIFEFARGTNTRFTFDPGPDGAPVWSPDGKRILYWSLRSGAPGWYQKAANGAGEDQLVFKTGGAPSSWSPDGRYVLYNDTQPPADLWALDLSSGKPDDRKRIRLVNSEYNDIMARFSPDGKWFSYTSNESGAYEIYVRSFNPASPGGSGKWMVSKGGSTEGGAYWRADGKELFYLRPDGTVMAVEVSVNPVFSAGVPKELFKVPAGILFFDARPDGKRFLMPVPSNAGPSTPPYKVVLNWTSTLRK